MQATSQAKLTDSKVDLKAEVLRARPTNPALQRLQRRVLASAEPSQVITSYDRMHHRHSRS
jgi:hypothetical protein